MKATGVACLSVALWATDARAGVAETAMPDAIQLGAAQQQSQITGRVVDESGNPVVGASVIAAGTNAAAITDGSGSFSIAASANETLQVSLFGYVSQTVAVGGRTTLNVVLVADALTVDEVVVVGYGVQKKSVVTAAIGSVKASDLENQTPTRIEGVLQGKVSGVNIVQDSGQPGSGLRVRIRGIGTTNDSDPLYVIDGMAVSGGIDQLNPTDIESIEVLKDGASAAVYGTRGANGVILVTTKRGRAGDARVTYDMQFGWQNPWKHREVLNTEQYMTLINEAQTNGGVAETNRLFGTDAKRALWRKNDTNWQKEVFNYNAPVQNHQIAVSGGSDRVNYYVSSGFLNQEGIIGGNFGKSNYDRMTLRSNLNIKLMDKSQERDFFTRANLGINATYAHTNTSGVGTNGVFGEPLGNALLLPPLLSVYFDGSTPFWNSPGGETAEGYVRYIEANNPGLTPQTDNNGGVFNPVEGGFGEINNPIAQMYTPTRKNWADKFVSSFWMDFEILKGLTFKTSYGVDLAFWGWNEWSRPSYFKSDNKSTIDPVTGLQDASSASAQFNRGMDWQLENTLTYQEQFGKHGITVLLGQSARSNRNSTKLEGSRKGLMAIMEEKAWIDFTSATTGTVSGGPVDPYRLASYFGRVSYNFDERYMLEGTLRRDGSSRFGANNKWANFPSVSAGWNVTEEAFAESFPMWLDNLKLRGSWGQNGNDRIGNYEYDLIMQSGNGDRYIFGPGNSSSNYHLGTKPVKLANANLMWETSEQINVGIDAAMFNSRLNFSFDWYQKNTKDMLIDMMVPTYVGDAKPRGNVGDMFNTGVEFELSYRMSRDKWNFGASFNATYLKNRIENLGNAEGYINRDDLQYVGTINRDENGLPYHFFFGRRTDGIFQNQAEVDSYVNASGGKIQPNAAPGDVRFRDLNNDGQISDADRTMIGKFFPDWTYNFTIDAAWNGLDLTMFWQGVAGSDVFDATRRLDRAFVNLPGYMLGRWTGEGTSNSIPRMNSDDKNGNWLSSDLYVQNGAYLRLKTIQLGYTIPEQLTRKAFVSRLRLYVMAENLITITGYRGFDPEMSSGFDRGVYPHARTLSVGLNLAF